MVAIQFLLMLLVFVYLILPGIPLADSSLQQQEITSYSLALSYPFIAYFIVWTVIVIVEKASEHKEESTAAVTKPEKEPRRTIFFFNIPADEVHPPASIEAYLRNTSTDSYLQRIYIYMQCSRKEFLNLVDVKYKTKSYKFKEETAMTETFVIESLAPKSSERIDLVFTHPAEDCPYRPPCDVTISFYAKTIDDLCRAPTKNLKVKCECQRGQHS